MSSFTRPIVKAAAYFRPDAVRSWLQTEAHVAEQNVTKLSLSKMLKWFLKISFLMETITQEIDDQVYSLPRICRLYDDKSRL